MSSTIERLELLLRRFGPSQVLLFTGAGFSSGALNVANEPIPAGKDLISYLKSQTNEDTDDLGLLAQMFIQLKGEHSLFTYLSTNYQASSTTQSHQDIIRFPWKAVYTTNYDNVSEFSATAVNIATRSYAPDQHPNDISRNMLPIIH